MKKLTFLLLSLTLCFSLAFGPAAQARVITVDGNGVKQVNANGDGVPEVDGVMVPIRAVLNAMGYSIAYDEETGLVRGGTFADPEFVFVPGEDGSVLVDGTTFIEAERIAEVLPFDMQLIPDGIDYTNTFSEMTEGWYKLSLDGRYLTARTLPEADLVETKTNEDGTEEEVTKTPTQQILATELFLAEDNGSDYQLWLMRKIGNKTYALINKATGLAADVNSWSRENGAKIIQYTLAAGTNQQFTFSAMDDGCSISPVYSRLFLTNVADDKFATGLGENVVIQTSDKSVRWSLEFIEGYTNPVLLAPETEAFAELDPYIQERFTSYFFTDADYSHAAKDKAETLLRGGDFAHQDKETQKQLIIDSLSATHGSFGEMGQRLTADYEIVSVTRTHDTYPEVLEQEDGKDYYIWTIAMECGGPDDIHTFTVETVDDNDEDHVRQVCDAMACFEPPVRKTLRHFYYTGESYGTWNAWAGEIWNNGAYKGSVDYMLPMFSHELGHVIDSYFTVGDDVWRRAINADMVPISDYGQTNRWEDFGEFSHLYLFAIGDANRMAALEKIYPNRTKAYRAALYNLDNEYYAQYKAMYDEVTAPIGDTKHIIESIYYTITTDEGALTNNEGVITIEENTEADNQLWQVYVMDDQLVKFYSKIDGRALYIPGTSINTAAEASLEESTAFGILPDPAPDTMTPMRSYASTTIKISETAYALDAANGRAVAVLNGSGTSWTLTPVTEVIKGVGLFFIRSDDGRYLVPETVELGSRLILSEDVDNSIKILWYIKKLPSGIGCITNALSGLAIDISGASVEEGAAALAYTLSRNDNQLWLIIENDNGTFSLQAQHSGLYLAVDEEGRAIQSETKYEWKLVGYETIIY